MPIKLSQIRNEAHTARRTAAAAAILAQPANDPHARQHTQDEQRAMLEALVRPIRRGARSEPAPPTGAESN